MQTRTLIAGELCFTAAGLFLSGLALLLLLANAGRDDALAERVALARIAAARILLRPPLSI